MGGGGEIGGGPSPLPRPGGCGNPAQPRQRPAAMTRMWRRLRSRRGREGQRLNGGGRGGLCSIWGTGTGRGGLLVIFFLKNKVFLPLTPRAGAPALPVWLWVSPVRARGRSGRRWTPAGGGDKFRGRGDTEGQGEAALGTEEGGDTPEEGGDTPKGHSLTVTSHQYSPQRVMGSSGSFSAWGGTKTRS